MTTRAAIRFLDLAGVFTVYMHHSNARPNGKDGVIAQLNRALDYAWPLPRYDGSDFAAAFVAANKPSATAAMAEMGHNDASARAMCGGTYRFLNSPKMHDDLSYLPLDLDFIYNVTCPPGGELMVAVCYPTHLGSKLGALVYKAGTLAELFEATDKGEAA